MESDSAYTSFAQVYDLFMDDVPYRQWCGYLCSVLASHGIADGTVLDLGCGTGKLARLMAANGYDMIGVDSSPEMLCIAESQQDDPGEKEKILYVLQDMRELALPCAVRAVYSACDCINYIPDPDGLRAVFERVYRCLEPGGLFMFDMNTPYKYEYLLGDLTFAENREEGSFIWENYFDSRKGVNEYDLTLFIPDGRGRYEKFEEVHCQRCYALGDVRSLLEESGFAVIGENDAYTDDAVRADSERVLYLAKKAAEAQV